MAKPEDDEGHQRALDALDRLGPVSDAEIPALVRGYADGPGMTARFAMQVTRRLPPWSDAPGVPRRPSSAVPG